MSIGEPVTLKQQIAEIKYELRYRRTTYPILAGKNGRKACELKGHMTCLEAALKTLELVQKNQQALFAAMDGDIE